MAGTPIAKLPARVKSGSRQLAVSLTDVEARTLERLRVRWSLRSWAAVIRRLIASGAVDG